MTLELESSGLRKRISRNPSSSKSGVSLQSSTESSARWTHSPTVLWEMEQLRAIARFDRPQAHFRRRTPPILRTVNPSGAFSPSFVFLTQRMPKLRKIDERRSLCALPSFRIPSVPSTESEPCRPPVPMCLETWSVCRRYRWTEWLGMSGPNPSESMVGMARIILSGIVWRRLPLLQRSNRRDSCSFKVITMPLQHRYLKMTEL